MDCSPAASCGNFASNAGGSERIRGIRSKFRSGGGLEVAHSSELPCPHGRGPLLLIAGGKGHTVPEAITKTTAKQYRHSSAVTDLIEFPDRGHSLTIDSGWREVATTAREWLHKQGL
jgi:pimeloyl-ACP methyl ester carboxylesterase